MARPLSCCNNPSSQLSQHFTRNCHINSSGSQEKVNNKHSSKVMDACSLHDKSAAAAAQLTLTQISYMPQIFSALIRKQVEALHRNLFVRDLKRFMSNTLAAFRREPSSENPVTLLGPNKFSPLCCCMDVSVEASRWGFRRFSLFPTQHISPNMLSIFVLAARAAALLPISTLCRF